MSIDGGRVTVRSRAARTLKMVGEIVDSWRHPEVKSYRSEMINCIFTVIFQLV